MLLAAEWGTGQVFWSLLWFFLFFLWLWLVITIFADIMRADEMSGWAKALWAIFIIVLPLLGALIYLIVNGDKMNQRAERDAQARDDAFRQYVQQSAAGGSASTSDQLAKLSDLHDRGQLSDDEYAAQKASLLQG